MLVLHLLIGLIATTSQSTESTIILLGEHGAIDLPPLDPTLVEFIRTQPIEIEASTEDSLVTNLILYYPSLYFTVQSLAEANGLQPLQILYYSILVETLQDDLIVATKGSDGAGIYLGLVQSLNPICDYDNKPICSSIFPKESVHAWKENIQDTLRDVSFYSKGTGILLGRGMYFDGTIILPYLTTTELTVTRVLQNSTELPYLRDHIDVGDVQKDVMTMMDEVDGKKIPLSWKFLDVALRLEARNSYLSGHYYADNPQYPIPTALIKNLSTPRMTTFPHYLASLTGSNTNAQAKIVLVGTSFSTVPDLGVQSFSTTSQEGYFVQMGCSMKRGTERCKRRYLMAKEKLNALGGKGSLDDLYTSLKTFPIRTVYTHGITQTSAGNPFAYMHAEQMCSEIYDSSHRAAGCIDPPLPTNWFVVIVSLILLGLTVTAWVYGIIFAKKFDKENMSRGQPFSMLHDDDLVEESLTE
ncbi:hypothetical protein GMRT_10396 [Giardia muris]|uniref:Uncharacterized protein n=1 Tax=Giardia muris TaxID=5742 RepID=A0A4Z1SXT8_GIAMU|nr:hypothetical protein GMRT_10396 [Giardia muris]|eukprot:TNJ30330.1 hypothetical protein GMRT_10396 [Giardia muris]